MKRQVVVATGNSHKVQELSDLFAREGLTDIELLPMSQVIGPLKIEEDGLTFAENALIKARAVYESCMLPTIADDSGLCIDVLEGQPGVRSARFGGPQATDSDNRDAVRRAMIQHGSSDSAARFVCVLCYIDQYRTFFTIGESAGKVVVDDQGSGGFGYDPMFIPDGFDLSYAQMSAEQKNAISHRGRATSEMIARLRDIELGTSSANAHELSRADLYAASAAAVIGRQDVVRAVASRAADEYQRSQVRETLLQTYLFAGFPAALDALATAHEVMGNRMTIDELEPFDAMLFQRRGEELCRKIYGRVYERMMERFEAISPSMRSWMIIEGYGKTLSRPGLSTLERELCIVCMLAVLGRTTQLYSHVRGAIAVGATMHDIAECMDVVVELSGRQAYELLKSTYLSIRPID
ncbi:MAG: RdgB/HAM1 family non-canonical purine NTP pyrophosphatase [Candidatus Kapabacteria bacterium]|nr:RdgB/HAM1 family non-canonical purine NTP pyrophosphatase [Candidatus Kapabacteria bacterium]